MWEIVADEVRRLGGEVRMRQQVTKIHEKDGRITGVDVRDLVSGETQTLAGDYFFSTMPVRELVGAITAEVPDEVRQVSDGLMYRDFMTGGYWQGAVSIRDPRQPERRLIDDNWISSRSRTCRWAGLQIFNNWSPYMVADPNTVWVGLEYFCNQGDELWTKPDAAMIGPGHRRAGPHRHSQARRGAGRHGAAHAQGLSGVLRHVRPLRRASAAGPTAIANLFLVGRNGMHRYNNQDHSMLTAMMAVDNIAAGRTDKANLWDVNTEQDYHEEKGAEEK